MAGPDDIIGLTDVVEKIGSMQESEAKAASDYDAVDNIGKNVTNSSLYGVDKKNKKEKLKPNLDGTEKTRLRNKMSIVIREWFTQKSKYDKDTKPETVVAKTKDKAKKSGDSLLSKEEGEKEGGGILDWITGLMGVLGLGGAGGRRGLMRTLGGWIWKGIKWGGSKIWGALKGVGQAGWNAIKSGFQGVGRFFSGLWQGFKGSGFWKSFTGAIGRGVSAAGNMLSSAKTALQGALNTVGTATRNALSTVTGGAIPKPGGGGGGGGKPPKPQKVPWYKKAWKNVTKTATAVKDFGAKKLAQAGQGIGMVKDAVVKKAVQAKDTVVRGAQFVGEKAKAGKDWLIKKVIEPAKALIRAGFAKVVGKGGANISKFLSTTAKRIPIIGPAIEALFTGLAIRKLKKRHEEDPEGYDAKQLNADAGTEVIKGIAGAVGSAGGAFLGGLAGAVSGPLAFLGVPIASFVGAVAGNLVAKLGASLVSKYIIPDNAKMFIGKTFTRVDHEKSPEKQAMGDIDMSYDPVDDFIWRPGYKPQPFNRNDIVMGMKRGGPIGEMVSNTTRTVSRLFYKTEDNIKSLMSHSRQPKPHTTVDQILRDPFLSAEGNEQEQSGRIAELQLKAIGVSNTYLSQLVQLTQALVKKTPGGAGGGNIVNVSPPSNSPPATQGDPSGPSVADSRVEFYNSPYSMHTPGTLA